MAYRRYITGIYRAIWRRQEGRCAYCGRKILRDQEKQIVDIRETGKKVERFAYIHASCSDRSVEYICTDTEPASTTELMELLNKLQKGQRPAGQKFLPLSKYFLDCTKPIFTLTFEEIENILGEKLGAAKHHKSFWRRTGFECISQAWLESGYEIQALHLDEERIVFHQTQKNTSLVHIPDVILSKRVPDAARYEIENYLAYIVKKYGL